MNVLHPVLVEKIIWSLLHGFSLRQIAHECEVHKETVRRYRRDYEAKHGAIMCFCGKPATHRGWCWVRFNRSKKRQAVMQSLHRRQRATPSAAVKAQ